MAAAVEGETIEGIPVVPWAEHFASLDWNQGEHVALVGPTGQGKTTLSLQLIELRRSRGGYCCIVGTKKKDPTLTRLGRVREWITIRRWPPPNADSRLVILWPKPSSLRDRSQAVVIRRALERIFLVGSWTVLADDTQYLTQHLGLRDDLNAMWLNARSNDVTMIGATQRPRHVPQEMWANSSHFYIWGTRNPDDVRALSGMAGVDAATVRRVVQQLPEFHCLYVPVRRPGEMTITKVSLQ